LVQRSSFTASFALCCNWTLIKPEKSRFSCRVETRHRLAATPSHWRTVLYKPKTVEKVRFWFQSTTPGDRFGVKRWPQSGGSGRTGNAHTLNTPRHQARGDAQPVGGSQTVLQQVDCTIEQLPLRGVITDAVFEFQFTLRLCPASESIKRLQRSVQSQLLMFSSLILSEDNKNDDESSGSDIDMHELGAQHLR
jgi:hypothetical protein